jgi:predicted TIM-barrel fold metal-dependent hydrolase
MPHISAMRTNAFVSPLEEGPMIDVHAHIFNLAYIPIRGVLEAWGVPPMLAEPAAAVFERLTQVDEAPASSLDRALAGAFAAEIELTTADLIVDIAVAVPKADLEAIADAVRQATEYLDSIETERRSIEYPPSLLLDVEFLGTDRERLVRMIRAVGRRVVGGDETLRWLLLMMNRESVIVTALMSLWEGGAAFVHHMMDMDLHYPDGRSRFEFVTEQIERVRRLVSQHDGRLWTFVAYSPIRPNAVEVIYDAVTNRDCVGVKFYPPSGYKPLGNIDGDIFGNATAEEVNGRNVELFRLCTDLDLPLFAHCSPGGMERVRGQTGLYSDPAYWFRALQLDGLAALRLCLGHAGGEDAWTLPHSAYGDREWERSWGSAVVSLCTTYPNVYCEFGHFDAVLDDEQRSKLQRRLERVVEIHGDAFGHKMMFGGDWHLLSRMPHYRETARVWRAMVRSSAALAPYERALFANNAVAYLRLAIAPAIPVASIDHNDIHEFTRSAE